MSFTGHNYDHTMMSILVNNHGARSVKVISPWKRVRVSTAAL